jgi:hypothetical protein
MSILNTRQKEGKIDIHLSDGWINPDELLSQKRVIISYHPEEQVVKIII